ncbi:MAG: hypothetical protein AAFW67_13765, partial [Cyanobacteria bacterium J06638_38]
GSIHYVDNRYLGQVQEIAVATQGRLKGTGGEIENLTARRIQNANNRAETTLEGIWKAYGANSFTKSTVRVGGRASFFATSDLDFQYDPGATVTGKRFVADKQSDFQAQDSTILETFWGDQPGEVYPGVIYQNVAVEEKYNLIENGCVLSIAPSGTELALTKGTIKYWIGDRWKILQIAAQTITPSGLTAENARFIYINLDSGLLESSAAIAQTDDLETKIMLAEVRGTMTSVTTLYSCLRNNSPQILAELNLERGIKNTGGLTLEKPDTDVPEFKLSTARILATGYSETGLVEKAAQPTVTYDLIKKDGSVYLADQTTWDFEPYEDTNSSIATLSGNNASIRYIYAHPID